MGNLATAEAVKAATAMGEGIAITFPNAIIVAGSTRESSGGRRITTTLPLTNGVRLIRMNDKSRSLKNGNQT